MPVIAVRWWGAGEGAPQEKKLHNGSVVVVGSVVTVSASYSSYSQLLVTFTPTPSSLAIVRV